MAAKKNLIIVESPGKISTISKIVGPDYIVKATVGHDFEISKDENAVDTKTFETKYTVIKGKQDIVNELNKLSKECDVCYIASDADREGEAIGWFVANRILDKKAKTKRIVFHEITKTAILHALQNPGEINQPLVNAQQARAVLDRLVGYKVSPFLWKYVASHTSAGRVQSIGLRLIVDRQKEINAFKTEEYWEIDGKFETKKNEELATKYKIENKIVNKESADQTVDSINKVKKWIVIETNRQKKSRGPQALFITSTMQQFASSQFGWGADKTMQVAQKLYEAGLITYHRTDSVNISKEAIEAVRKLIKDNYGTKYLPSGPVVYKSKKSAQEAHEGIRPSHLEESLEDVKSRIGGDELKLFEGVWRKFVACQMTWAEFDVTKITIESDDKKHQFTCSGQILAFDGFLKAWTYTDSKDSILPEIIQGSELKLQEVIPSQHFTKPPAHYNDASLVKTLEEKGIGRPSTYASIIKTLKKRLYVEQSKVFTPTVLGTRVCEFLVKAFPDLMNENYTSRIEDQLDEIAEDKKVWQDVVRQFWSELEKYLQKSGEVGQQIKKDNVSDIDCPKCKKNKLVKRFGRFGPFYGCAGYSKKECSAMFKIGPNGEPLENVKKEIKYVEGKLCPCGGKIVIRVANRTQKEFGGCSNYPKCSNIFTLEGEKVEPKEKTEGGEKKPFRRWKKK